jgi:hypothetical protein
VITIVMAITATAIQKMVFRSDTVGKFMRPTQIAETILTVISLAYLAQ